jgi:hypothetical protein
MSDAASGALAPANRSEAAVIRFPTSPTVDACLRAIERVEQILEQETAALRSRQRSGLDDFNRRKSHGLLDLTRAMRAIAGPADRAAIAPHLKSLRAALAQNAALLKLNVDAVQEVSSIMALAIRDGDSDGTYSATIRFPAGRRS